MSLLLTAWYGVLNMVDEVIVTLAYFTDAACTALFNGCILFELDIRVLKPWA